MTSLGFEFIAAAIATWLAVQPAAPAPRPTPVAATRAAAKPATAKAAADESEVTPTPTRDVDAAPARPVFSVVPGGSGSPLGTAPKRGTPQLVWTGFQVTESGSRVFVQTTAEVELKVEQAKGSVTVTLHNCRVRMRNNSRLLDTRFFASPVERIAVRQRRHDIQLDIALRAPAQSTSRQEAGPGGTHFWVIDFARPEKVATGD